MKKWWNILTVIVIVACCCTVLFVNSIHTAEWEYETLEDGTIELTKYLGSSENVVIPNKINNKKVTSFYLFSEDSEVPIRRLTLPNSITEFESNPFVYLSDLEEVVVPENHPALKTNGIVLTSMDGATIYAYYPWITTQYYNLSSDVYNISRRAFQHSSLTGIFLPAHLQRIYPNAFEYCESLISIDIPDSVWHFGQSIFNGCTSLKSVKLPAELSNIGTSTFSGCKALSDIVLPETILTIGDYAFSRCESLEITELPPALRGLGTDAFYGCHSLQRIILPDTLENVKGSPFGNCSNLTEIVVSEDHAWLEVIDGALIRKDNKRLLSYPNGLTAETYTVPEGVSSIAMHAFTGDSALTTLILPETVTEIRPNAFFQSDTLTHVVIPDSVTSIQKPCFKFCPNLTLVVGENSYAAQWAKDNGIPYIYPDSLDWLTN